MRLAYLIAGIFLFIMPVGASAADLETLVEDCNGCHGDGGVSQWTDVPTIAGIDAFSHSEALFIYQDGARPCAESEYRTGDTSRTATTMCDIAAGLDDDQIESLSAHYSALEFTPAKQDFDAALAEQGAAIHKQHCTKCHSDGGSNPDDEASILAGQWMGYLESSFADYLSGERDQIDEMAEKLEALSADDVTALLHYYASQQ